MQVTDVWGELHTLFEGEAKNVQEIDLVNLRQGSMAECLTLLFNRARECSVQTLHRKSQQEIHLPSPHSIVNHVLQEQVSLSMWLTLPALPTLSVFIDYRDQISFGYIRGAWHAMEVLSFFDLLYEVRHMSPYSKVIPSEHCFNKKDQQKFNNVWQDYLHEVS